MQLRNLTSLLQVESKNHSVKFDGKRFPAYSQVKDAFAETCGRYDFSRYLTCNWYLISLIFNRIIYVSLNIIIGTTLSVNLYHNIYNINIPYQYYNHIGCSIVISSEILPNKWITKDLIGIYANYISDMKCEAMG